jgi:hypothetical protein
MIEILAVVCLIISFLCLFNIFKAILTKKTGGNWWPIFLSDIADKNKDSFYFWIMFARWMIGFIGLFICGVKLLIIF